MSNKENNLEESHMYDYEGKTKEQVEKEDKEYQNLMIKKAIKALNNPEIELDNINIRGDFGKRYWIYNLEFKIPNKG